MAEANDSTFMTTTTVRAARGARRPGRRVGRGLGSGSGVYAGRGRKGQKARAGRSPRPGFEGGQTRLEKRLPYRRGVRGAGSVMTGGPPRRKPEEVTVERLARFAAGMEVTPAALREAGLVGRGRVKVLGGGRLTVALTVKAHGFTKGAKAAIEGAGGKAEVLQ
jgi:large subunit ribosomal protein L15